MIRKTALSILSVAVLLIADAATVNVAQAFDMGNMMNPSRWFDDDDRYDRGYYRGGYGPWGYGGPYGWGGYPGYGGGWGGYPGYGGWGGYPGYGGYGGYGQQAPSTIVVNPTPETSKQVQPPAPRLPE